MNFYRWYAVLVIYIAFWCILLLSLKLWLHCMSVTLCALWFCVRNTCNLFVCRFFGIAFNSLLSKGQLFMCVYKSGYLAHLGHSERIHSYDQTALQISSILSIAQMFFFIVEAVVWFFSAFVSFEIGCCCYAEMRTYMYMYTLLGYK